MPAVIKAVFVGGPKTLLDARGEWRSSIGRERCEGPVVTTCDGLVGDKVTQPYHGGKSAAVCVHLAEHYRFWKTWYGVGLQPGAVGENLTLAGMTEDDACVGDVVRLGTVLAQVSGPRVPCANLARHLGRPDWVKLTIRENRTGFYMRVLEPGALQAGDAWVLEERFDPEASVSRMSECMYLKFDPDYARRMLQMTGLGVWWREQAAEKLRMRDQHWTSRLRESDAEAGGAQVEGKPVPPLRFALR